MKQDQRDNAAMRLELIAAKAKQMAEDLRQDRLWRGDFSRGIAEINDQLGRMPSEGIQ